MPFEDRSSNTIEDFYSVNICEVEIFHAVSCAYFTACLAWYVTQKAQTKMFLLKKYICTFSVSRNNSFYIPANNARLLRKAEVSNRK